MKLPGDNGVARAAGWRQPERTNDAPGNRMDYNWEFAEAKPTGWVWRCVDRATGSVVRLSKQTFPVLYDCVEDAKRHGFTPPPLRVESENSGTDAPTPE